MNDGPACYWCHRTENCPECAERRARIDQLADRPPRTADEIRAACDA